ncbi:hypothetical protein Ciccas_013672 [Cichlidogyrus casuarinus]|uniref:Phosphatidylinositol transfer protein N-terminal domain-containing protein n=1 Tax=Cichlidogyrus casuarinus TaxID=1844966 RepID=A0ABD2PKH7_9PLAT
MDEANDFICLVEMSKLIYLGTALRKTMVKAHRQAWAWQDEWYGLSMRDIRLLEEETARALQAKLLAKKNSSVDLCGGSSSRRLSQTPQKEVLDPSLWEQYEEVAVMKRQNTLDSDNSGQLPFTPSEMTRLS